MTQKIAISIDDKLLADVEETSRAQGLTRSALFARAAREFIKRERSQAADDRYEQSYRDVPETDEEMAGLDEYARSPRAWSPGE
jgi:metal-responsive CopG/Arc/MetJ family transcriptional regulator